MKCMVQLATGFLVCMVSMNLYGEDLNLSDETEDCLSCHSELHPGLVSSWLASRHKPAALIIESSFSSGAGMARRLYPIFPARLLTRLKYPAADYVRRIGCPLLVVHSRDDEIIPFTMGQALYAAAREPKAFIELRGDHNAGFWISREEYTAGLAEFFERVLL